MIVRYTYRCPNCGEVKTRDIKQEFAPKNTEIIRVCQKCRPKK